jgi:hypothetical protein
MPAGAWILRMAGYLYLRESASCIDIDNNGIKTIKECINMFKYMRKELMLLEELTVALVYFCETQDKYPGN